MHLNKKTRKRCKLFPLCQSLGVHTCGVAARKYVREAAQEPVISDTFLPLLGFFLNSKFC